MQQQRRARGVGREGRGGAETRRAVRKRYFRERPAARELEQGGALRRALRREEGGRESEPAVGGDGREVEHADIVAPPELAAVRVERERTLRREDEQAVLSEEAQQEDGRAAALPAQRAAAGVPGAQRAVFVRRDEEIARRRESGGADHGVLLERAGIAQHAAAVEIELPREGVFGLGHIGPLAPLAGQSPERIAQRAVVVALAVGPFRERGERPGFADERAL